METPSELSLANLGGGALAEAMNAELRKLCANVADPNVQADAKRKITITIEVKPDEKRSMAGITFKVDSKLPPFSPGKTAAYIALDPDTRELSLFEVETHPNLFPKENPHPDLMPLKGAKQA